MPTLRLYRVFCGLVGIALIGLLAACGSAPTTAGPTATRPVEGGTPGATATLSGGHPPVLTPTAGMTEPVPPTQTGCPAANSGRPAVLAPLALGNDQALLYTVETQGSSAPPAMITLYRYDAATGAKTVLLRFSHEFFIDAQISADGQWLLFVTGNAVNAPEKLQLIRMDGQGLQTLYCGSVDSVQWSADQKLVSFYSTDKGNGLYLLNLQTGGVQRELDLSPVPYYAVVTWLDATRLYLDNPGVDAPASGIFILDTSKGPDQKPSDLLPVFQVPNDGPYAFVNFDSSYNGQALFVSLYNRLKGSSGAPGAPSSIEMLPAAGGSARTLYSSSTLAIPALRVIDSSNNSSLCLLVENFDGNTGQNGLWKMNADGSGLTRLTTFGSGTDALFNEVAQFPWSNFSRDSSLYGIWTTMSHGLISTYSLLVGSLQGGTPTTIESDNAAGMQLAIVGWTTV